MSDALLALRDVHMHFPIRDAWGRRTGWLRAVDGVTLSVPRGDILGVVGESGCGKTTLGKTIVGIHRASSGDILFEGNEVGALSAARGPSAAANFAVPATRTPERRSIRTGRSAARWQSHW